MVHSARTESAGTECGFRIAISTKERKKVDKMLTQIGNQDKQDFQRNLVDCSRKIYKSKKYVPRITFWGFYHVFCLDEDTAAIAGYPDDHSENRMAFLKQIFGQTTVDPWNFLLMANRSPKTERNLLSGLWHLSWKYKKLPNSFQRMLKAFQDQTELALDGVARKLSAMIDSRQIDPQRAGAVAYQLLDTLYANYLCGAQTPDPERSMAVLLMACLLGDDVVFNRQCGPVVSEWLDRKRSPAGLLMVRLFHNSGIYHIEDAQINTKLLPDIVCDGKRYNYQSGPGSPLRQIITEQRFRWILLSGQSGDEGDSTMSGAGKTTSLRFLALEERGKKALWLPLAEIYDHHNLSYAHLLSRHISATFHMDLRDLPDSTFFLLDGLDELIDRAQLEQLSSDLYMLQHSGRFGLVVSSKFPWDQMSQIDIFYQWSNVWGQFQPCFIQNLSEWQIQAALPKSMEDDRLSQLNTPFLLALHLQAASLPDDPWTQKLIERWAAKGLFQNAAPTEELIFYRSLIVQIIRWYEASQGQKICWEMDAFFLFHTIPAIACQMCRSEGNDPDFDPVSAIKVDRGFLARIVDDTWHTVRSWLHCFPGYSASGLRYEKLLQGIDFDKFCSGAVTSLFHGEWNGRDQLTDPQFTNHSLRDNLALLHLANIFLLAQAGALGEDPQVIEAYGYTVELFPAKQLQKAAAYYELITKKSMSSILRLGPDEAVQSPVSRFLAGHIGATMCEHIPEFRQDHKISSAPWYQYMFSAFQQLEDSGNSEVRRLVEQRFGLAYIYGQTICARNYRSQGQYDQANLCAEHIITFQNGHPNLINSDGYHVKALVLFEQIQRLLNGKSCGELQTIHTSEVDAADRLTQELAALSADPHARQEILPPLSQAQTRLVPVFAMLLDRAKRKRDAYAQRKFFCDSTLEFLCCASYVAKYNCILAALSPGHSGAAYNLLGSLMANDSECLENNPCLPFFARRPQLHLDILDLAYDDRPLSSFHIYLLVYNIRRGPQPYSARRLCEFLLRRQVRLDDAGQPCAASGDEAFTQQEFAFLEQATARALMNRQNSEAYWRARYLHELALQAAGTAQFQQKLDRAKAALKTAWAKTSCTKKCHDLLNSRFSKVDFLSALVMIEDLLMDRSRGSEERKSLYTRLFQYLHSYWTNARAKPIFTTGSAVQFSDIQDCLSRMDQLKQGDDWFTLQDLKAQYPFA